MKSREEVMKETHDMVSQDILKEKQKKFIKIFLKVVLFLVIFITVVLLYITNVATNGLVVKEMRIKSDKLPESFNSTKIIQFSDLYYGSSVEFSEVKNLVKNINERSPDVVIFTGNLINSRYNISNSEKEKLIKYLSRIDTNFGKFAISGYEDFDDSLDILRNSGFKILDNESDTIYNDSDDKIFITGLNSDRAEDVEKAFSLVDSNIFNILMLESPDYIDNVSEKNISLALAGKSLNGEVCLKKDLCLYKVKGAKKYYMEYYKVNGTKLFISSGIGTSKYSFRFMARPSINFFRLSSK